MTKSFDFSQFLLVRSEQDWVKYKLTFTQGVEALNNGPLNWAVPERYPCLCASFLIEEAVRSDTGDVQVIDVVVTSFCYEEDAKFLVDAINSTDSKVNVAVEVGPVVELVEDGDRDPAAIGRVDSATALAVATALELEALGAIKPQQLTVRYHAVLEYCVTNGTGTDMLKLFQNILEEKGTA